MLKIIDLNKINTLNNEAAKKYEKYNFKNLNNVSLYEAANVYQNVLGWGIGWCVGKACYVDEWTNPNTNLTMSDDELEERFAQNQNGIGCILGRSGLVTVDIDDLETFENIFGEIQQKQIDRFGESFLLSGTLCSKSGNDNSAKYWFVKPENLELEHKELCFGENTIFELRASCKNQDLLPPSRYKDTDKKYQWSGGNFPKPMPPSLIDLWLNFDAYAAELKLYNPNYREELLNEWNKKYTFQKASSFRQNKHIEQWIREHPLKTMLKEYGFVEHKNGRYSLPYKNNQGIQICQDGDRFWSYSESSPFKNHPANSFDLLVEYEYKGDYDKAFKHVIEEVKEEED